MVEICHVGRSQLTGRITPMSDKTYTHRAILIASVSEGTSRIHSPLISRDTLASIEAGRALGADIEYFPGQDMLRVDGNRRPRIVKSGIDASNSGTTMRITAAIASVCEGRVTIDGDDSLRSRPMQPIVDTINALGASCVSNNGKAPLTITGRDGAEGGEIVVDGSISSQFVSGLLIAAPLMERGLTLNIKNELVSKTYVDSTIATMKKFGVAVKVIEPYKKYRVDRADYRSTNFVVPSDFSGTALLLAANVLVGREMEIAINIDVTLPQADSSIVPNARRLGADVYVQENVIGVRASDISGGTIDLSNSPDSLPAVAAMGLKSSNWVRIVNVKQARFKETDRIAVLSRELPKLGAIVEEKPDGLWIRTEGDLRGAALDSRGDPAKEGDHRMFMAFAIAGMYVGNTTVTDPNCVDVSYSKFIPELERLGAQLRVSPSLS
ncbi:MAG TPA: 3-phosphoshikimate 1-carboxyvinyltransferase [Candidatus Acidoferrales bacterium]|nr:3-phosphoshikimate 1-carboxyvinyltransferase [Candidatus Acidoferrales bacterium]